MSISSQTPALATNSTAGLVKGSLERDKISVNPDGTMNVNDIGVNRLVNVSGVELILDGGYADNGVQVSSSGIDGDELGI